MVKPVVFKFGGTSLQTAERINKAVDIMADFEKRNKIVAGFFKIDGNIITVNFTKKLPTETEAQNVALPFIPIIVVSGFVLGAAWIWHWTVTSVTEAVNAVDNLFDNPIIAAALFGIIAFVAVEIFKRATK